MFSMFYIRVTLSQGVHETFFFNSAISKISCMVLQLLLLSLTLDMPKDHLVQVKHFSLEGLIHL